MRGVVTIEIVGVHKKYYISLLVGKEPLRLTMIR